jgi:hypothetical protein
MLVSFNTLPDSARTWIYQSSRHMTEAESSHCRAATELFVQNWTAHDAGLKGGVQILYNLFIIIGVDENYNDASGCSIDKKVNFIKQLGAELQIDFFNRLQIAYLEDEKIKLAGMHDLTGWIKSGKMTADTVMFNNLVSTVNELKENWRVPVSSSWMKQLVVS